MTWKIYARLILSDCNRIKIFMVSILSGVKYKNYDLVLTNI